ncbi:hypothetical protein MMC09_003415 [Bachmanniomyces sp. S44760]|nr:hypothetical protein [Bachmanniomyces sp. S44760]
MRVHQVLLFLTGFLSPQVQAAATHLVSPATLAGNYSIHQSCDFPIQGSSGTDMIVETLKTTWSEWTQVIQYLQDGDMPGYMMNATNAFFDEVSKTTLSTNLQIVMNGGTMPCSLMKDEPLSPKIVCITSGNSPSISAIAAQCQNGSNVLWSEGTNLIFLCPSWFDLPIDVSSDHCPSIIQSPRHGPLSARTVSSPKPADESSVKRQSTSEPESGPKAADCNTGKSRRRRHQHPRSVFQPSSSHNTSQAQWQLPVTGIATRSSTLTHSLLHFYTGPGNEYEIEAYDPNEAVLLEPNNAVRNVPSYTWWLFAPSMQLK